MKFIKCMAIALLMMSANTVFAAVEDVYGRWGGWQIKPGNGLVLDLSFEFDQNNITLYNKCSFRGQSLEVSVTVPVKVTDTEIHSLGSAENSASKAGLDCNVAIEPAVLTYELKGARKNQLILREEGNPKPLKLKRMK